MVFTKRLHAPIMSGDVTCTVRIWRTLRVKVGELVPEFPGLVIALGCRCLSML